MIVIMDTAAWHLFLTLTLGAPRLEAWPAEPWLRDLGPGALLPGFCHLTWQRDSAGAIRVTNELTLNEGEDPGLSMGHCDHKCPVEQDGEIPNRRRRSSRCSLKIVGGGGWHGKGEEENPANLTSLGGPEACTPPVRS